MNGFRQLKHKRYMQISVAATYIIFLLISPSAYAVGKGFYPENTGVTQGMIVGLTQSPGYVAPAHSGASEQLVGVVSTSQSDLPVAQGQIMVQDDGTVNTLVSTYNGQIKVGDRIGLSPLEGVGQKAESKGWVVGIAQGSFDETSSGAVKTSVQDNSGQSREVLAGSIPVLIQIMNYSAGSESDGNADSQASKIIPDNIQKIAEALAGKSVSTRALLISFALIIFGLIGAAVIVSSALRNGFLAISRQPLSKFAILREERRAFVFALGLLAVSFGASYIVIRLL
jgi:hypothetical protein